MTEPIHVEVRGGTPPPAPQRGGGPGFFLLLPGLLFIGLGILVLVWPDMLKIMVATAFIMVGMGLCVGGLRLRRVSQSFSAFGQQFPPR